MRCVCGRYMRRTEEHLNYIKWECSNCGHTEVRWRGADPECIWEGARVHVVDVELRPYLADVIRGAVAETVEDDGVLLFADG